MDREAVRCGRLIGTDRCGSLLQRGCLSCPKCEGTVDASVWEDVPSLRVCGAALGDGSRCDWQISFNCKFCPECGIKLGSESRWPNREPIPATGEGGQGSALDSSTSTVGLPVMESCTDVANLGPTHKENVDATIQMADEARQMPEMKSSVRDSDTSVFSPEHEPSPDPAIVAVGPPISNPASYFNETPLAKVSKAMMALPDVDRNVAPIIDETPMSNVSKTMMALPDVERNVAPNIDETPLSKVSKAMMALPDVDRNVAPIIDETPMSNVSKTMMALPDVERNVAPNIATEEDGKGVMQEPPSLCPVGPEASRGYSSAFVELQYLVHQLPEHQQTGIELSDVIQRLAKSMQVPSVTEVSPCDITGESLPSPSTGTSRDGGRTAIQRSEQRSKPGDALLHSDSQLCPSRPEQYSQMAGADRVDVNGNSDQTVSIEAMQSISQPDSDQFASTSSHYGTPEKNEPVFGQGIIHQQSVRSEKEHEFVKGPHEGNVSKEVASIEEKITAGHVGDQNKKPPSVEKVMDGNRGQSRNEGTQKNVTEEQRTNVEMKTEDKNRTDHDGSSDNKGQKDTRDHPSRIIDKKNTMEKNLVEPKAKGKGKSAAKMQSPEKITVQFHVLVSHEFHLGKDDKVIIRFENKWGEGGGWECKKHQLDHVREIVDGHWLMTIKIAIPQYMTSYPGLEYKYFIIKHGKVMWEFLEENNKSSNRSLQVPKNVKMQNGENWHQYDTVVKEKTADGLWSTFKKVVGISTKDHNVEIATVAFLPQWEDVCFNTEATAAAGVTLEDALRQINQVVYWMKASKKLVQRILADYLRPHIEWLATRPTEKEERPDEATKRLSMALAVIHVMHTNNVQLSGDDATVLCEALLLRTPGEDHVCHDFNGVIRNFPNMKPAMIKSLLGFLEKCIIGHCECRWLLAVPLCHFLQGCSVPYKSIHERMGTDHETRVWWGVEKLWTLVQKFKETTQRQYKDVNVSFLLDRLEPLFPVDQLLQRTLMAAMTVNQIEAMITSKKIAPEVCMANLAYFLKNNEYHLKQKMAACLEPVTIKIQELQDETPGQSFETYVGIVTHISLDLLLATLSNIHGTSYYAVLEAVLSVVAASISTLHSALRRRTSDQRDTKGLLNMAEQAFNRVTSPVGQWLSTCLNWRLDDGYSHYAKFADPFELEIWSRLLGIEFGHSDYTDRWRQQQHRNLASRISKMRANVTLELYCTTDFTKYNPLLESLFSEYAFEALDDPATINVLFDQANSGQGIKIRVLLSHMFLNNWPKDPTTKALSEEPTVVLNHILGWPSFARCLELNHKFKKRAFTDPCCHSIDVAINCLNRTIEDLMMGQSRLDTLKFILTHKDVLQEICTIQANWDQLRSVPTPISSETSPIQVVQKVLSWRRSELTQLESKQKMVMNMLGMVDKLESVDTDDLKRRLSSINGDTLLRDVCEPQQYTPESAGEISTTMTYFDLSDGVERVLETLSTSRVSESQLFDTLWTQQGKRVSQKREPSDRRLSLDDVVTEVWLPVTQHYDDLCTRVQNGSVTLGEVDNFLSAYVGHYPDLEHEFQLMCQPTSDASWIKQRVYQVQQYHELDQCCCGARLIMEARQAFELTGDFAVLETIVRAVEDRSTMLRSVSNDVVSAKTDLINVTPQQVDCIGTVIKCKPLLDWLKGNIRDVKELNVLTELAMCSAAGQGDLEVERVSCLHAAATGFAPFIYDLHEDTDFKHFMTLCNHVWHALANDPNLPMKLHDTCRNIDWLRNVKDSHGSVELNAISQAKTINARGIYHVGKQEGIEPEGAKDVVHLVLLPETKGDERKTYTFQQLQDLQSKLMLVAGKAEKGKDDVDTFTEILDGVTRLATIYVKMCASGSILFRGWVSSFYCEPGRTVNADIDFGLSKQMMHGLRAHRPTVALQIQAVCEFFDECYTDWIHHIEVQRRQFYYLNHFTTQQVVILCKRIASFCFGDDRDVDPLVYPMLCAVKHDCCVVDLRRAVKSAFQDLAEREKHAREGRIDAGASDLAAEPEQENVKERRDFIDAMMDADFSEELAKRALREMQTIDIDEGLVWCMDRMGDDPSNDDDGKGHSNEETASIPENDTRTPFEVLHVTESFDSVAREQMRSLKNMNGSLEARLRELWCCHLEAASASVTDYLSVEHLGCILEDLTDLGEIARPLPHGLVKGVPNLVVCPEADILRAVLSLYLQDGGQNLPLPRTDEVLLCTELTSEEEVDLLYRRAAKDRQGKIYCLANADLLDYEVSEKAESYLEKHIKGNQDCRLVVICSKEREERSRLVAALDKHRVNAPHISKMTHIQAYLKRHFQQDCAARADNLHHAAEVDPERCSVRVVKSDRAGVGKSLRVKRLAEELTALNGAALYQGRKSPVCVTVTLQQKAADHSDVLRTLVQHTMAPDKPVPRVFHFDIAHETYEGVDNLLFNLLVLGSLTDQSGLVWRRSSLDLYTIETLPLLWRGSTNQNVLGAKEEQAEYVHRILALLPSLTCRSPQQSINVLSQQESPALLFDDWTRFDQLMDEKEFRSAIFQRPYQYLTRFSAGQPLHTVAPRVPEGSPEDCLRCLLRYCGIPDPSWAELRHFVWFLNVQLCDAEHSSFCSASVQEDLPGFVRFVVHFMIQMSKDFATRSLDVSEETPGLVLPRAQIELVGEEEGGDEPNGQNGDAAIVPFQLRRRWETSPHPYLFFNSDRHSMTFLGFYIDPATGHLLDPRTGGVLEHNVMPRPLQDGLRRNFVQLNENFDGLARQTKIQRLCSVMGIEDMYDPDEEYELTADNVKKILAIHMRLRCGIPVVIMGETGCGKTRLVKFMCDLWKPPGTEHLRNMVLVKVHGGTTERDIIRKVDQASQLAQTNRQEFPRVDTVLFFDEANTTEAIGLIKEIICDKRMKGRALPYPEGLKVIAACNPYRKHSDEMIQRLEQAGLGYRVRAHETKDKLGYIPMRQLVYRVQALPRSILPLVWDFGQLTIDVEKLYIAQMVHRCIREEVLPNVMGLQNIASDILATSQEFMRNQQEECSFVSLRDVKRVLDVMTWFYERRNLLFHFMDELALKEMVPNSANDDEEEPEYEPLDDVTRSLVLALGVCYHACLQNRQAYREYVAGHFVGSLKLPNGATTILEEINRCEDVFLDGVQLEPNIARNQALKENIFMMIVCIELRIPLFLVGKPGSSKSLARTIVADAMQGKRAHSELFRQLKEAYMISFQCSPLSTPEGIVGTFRQCSQLQKDKDLTEFVAVVVLDEVGLAEDSPSMPLKTLHPLLEDGCEGDEEPAPHKKVAFIGISNWSLDPAKMNRGILVQRGIPDESELQNSARGICSTDKIVQQRISPYVLPMAMAYLELYNSAVQEIREFFGLRDFYSLIKMVAAFSKKSRLEPTWPELVHAIKRNFGGLDCVDPVAIFERNMHNIDNIDRQRERKASDPPCDAAGLIRSSLWREMPHDLNNESRYLLVLTENYAALSILPQLLDMKDTITIFGSSFPKDQEYMQVCRNINRIKVCMETGKTIVLLNLENLYESLYDALNQYYVYLGGHRFVDLGLGTHRVKCRVHEDFRLIVVAEKQVVYDKFPIPLINRLEKHFLAMTTMLDSRQMKVLDELKKWARAFAVPDTPMTAMTARGQRLTEGDVFIGYHDDTAASLVLQVSRSHRSGTIEEEEEDAEDWASKTLRGAQDLLLQCATPESVIRLRNTTLRQEEAGLADIYFNQQRHGSLTELLFHLLRRNDSQHRPDELFVQVTTHSKLLSDADVESIGRDLGMARKGISHIQLQAFPTEHQFSRRIREFISGGSIPERLLLLQCDSGDRHSELIACARHNIENEYNQATRSDQRRHVVFVIQLPRIAGGCFTGFQGGKWTSCHIDDLQPQRNSIPPLLALTERSISSLFRGVVRELEDDDMVEGLSSLGLDEAGSDGQPGELVDDDVECHSQRDTYATGEDLQYPSTIARGLEQPTFDAGETYPSGKNLHGDSIMPRGPESMSTDVDAVSLRRREVYRKGNRLNLQDSSAVSREQEPPSFDVDDLIQQCLHAAGMILKDAEDVKDRKTDRVRLLLQVLKPNKSEQCELSFIGVLRKRIYLLLKDKEDTAMVADMAQRWLSNEVASMTTVNRAGTFRQAVRQHLQAKITPMLAAIVSLADVNAGMDLLADEDSPNAPWIHAMFLSMLDDPHIVTLTYADIQSSALQKVELSELAVRTTGCDGAVFRARLPFSWVIKNHVDMLVHQTQRMPDKSDLAGLVCRVLRESPLGMILEELSAGPKQKEDVTRLYLADFVHMVHRPTSAHPSMELEIVARAIISAAREAFTRDTASDDEEPSGEGQLFELTIPGIHLVYNRVKRRLQLFSEAARLWPGCVVKLEELTQNATEMTLDVEALLLLLQSLTPTGDRLNDTEQRADWLRSVQRFKPLVEQVLSVVDSSSVMYGERSLELAQACRRAWTRVSAVELFVSHVCPVTMDNKILGIKRCMPLWKMLEKHDNFKKFGALQQVEKFLRMSNSEAYKSFFGKLENCKQCDNLMTTPVRLPCRHIICDSCVVQLEYADRRKCPQCKKTWDNTDDLPRVEEKNEPAQRYDAYKERCNMFFMELVSRLCFESGTPPERGVVQRLLEYVTCQSEGDDDRRMTRPMTVLHCIDPTPVVRSLLLQLLLRSEVSTVKEHLQQYFDEARQVLNQNSAQLLDLCLLFVHCLEDSYHNKASRLVESEAELLTMAKDSMNEARLKLNTQGVHVDKLEAIALTRFGLSHSATWMEKVHVRRLQCCHMTEVFDAAAQLCDQPLRYPRLFLMRQLSRRFGLDSLHTVGAVPRLRWVIPKEARNTENDGIPDRFIMAGENYKIIREVITRVVLGEESQIIDDALQKMPQDAYTERSLLLALYTDVTVSYASRDASQMAPPEALAKLGTFCANSTYIKHKDLADKMLTNRLGVSDHVIVSANHNARHVTIASMFAHFTVVMRCSVPGSQILQPFMRLITDPASMQMSYLPTIPQDATQEVREALLAARGQRGGDQNPVLWQCPNGHPYVIGDCGRPGAVYMCTVCSQPIGGIGHRPAPGNQTLADHERSTGHRLGPAEQRSTHPAPEREMSPAQSSMLRLLTHMAMYLGANDNPQSVAGLIKPAIGPEQVSQFLWDHICHDTQVLTNAVGKSLDDCATLMNLLMCNLMTPLQGQDFRGDIQLRSDIARQNWESAFIQAYVTPLLTGLDEHLKTANRMLVNDERLGNNALMRELYETEMPQMTCDDLQHVETAAAIWCHRSRVTVEHLTHELNESSQGAAQGNRDKRHRILRMFLYEEHQLQALRFLPSVVRLQRILLERYQGKIDRAEANNLRVSDFLDSLQDDHARDEHMTLLDHFGQAWNLLREAIAKVGFGGIQVPKEFCEETIDRDTSLAMLLPALKGLGVCSFALLLYLATMQNNFMEEYSKLTKQSCEECVSVRDVTTAHLISFHPEKDLLPMVLSCCQYSLQMGKGYAITYDFGTLQRQIEERFIRNRPRLDPQMDMMAFREDFTSASIFSNLDKRIPQEPLGQPEQRRISNEMRHLTDLTNSLANLDIAIGFLVSVGGEPESLLASFMKETLRMKATIHSHQAHQFCCLKHVKSLWLLLSHERAKQLACYGQDAFDNMDEKYREPVPEELLRELDAVLRHINVGPLLSALYECCLLHITVKQDSHAEDYTDNQDQPLLDLVDSYLDATNGPSIQVLANRRFPANILAKHCLDTWRHIALYASRLQHRGN